MSYFTTSHSEPDPHTMEIFKVLVCLLLSIINHILCHVQLTCSSILLLWLWRNHNIHQDIYQHCCFALVACFLPLQMSSDAPTACVPADDQAFQEVLGYGRHLKNPERMNALIWAEHEDDDQPPCHHHRSCQLPKKSTIINNDNFFSALPVEDASDADNGDFTGDDSGSSSELFSLGSDSDIQEITNVEVSYFLCFSWLVLLIT